MYESFPKSEKWNLRFECVWAWVGGWLEAQLSRVTSLSIEESYTVCAPESLRICLFGVPF